MFKLLVRKAIVARTKASANYSGFKVGAAVKTEQGNIFTGGNVESDCSSVGVCAEQVAISNAILAGETPIEIAIVADTKTPITPCGKCRQFMLDFTPLKVTMANLLGDVKQATAKQLLPIGFERREKV